MGSNHEFSICFFLGNANQGYPRAHTVHGDGGDSEGGLARLLGELGVSRVQQGSHFPLLFLQTSD